MLTSPRPFRANWQRKIGRHAPLMVVSLLVVGLGVWLLLATHAATPVSSTEAESGQVTSPAAIVSDSKASAGSEVQFGSASTGGGGTSQSCTNPTYTIPSDHTNNNDAQTGQQIGNFYVTNDTWNTQNYAGVAQTLFVCNYNNWYVTATMNNNTNDGAVKSYPNVQQNFSQTLGSFKTITSTYSEVAPHVGIYEYAYDMWTDNYGTELMIWTDNFNQTPGGSSNGTFSDGGVTYTIYKSGSYIAFVPPTNSASGSVNILDFYKEIIAKGWDTSNSVLNQIDYGVELVSTNGAPTNFAVNGYSLTTN